jgi:hypothetical protein
MQGSAATRGHFPSLYLIIKAKELLVGPFFITPDFRSNYNACHRVVKKRFAAKLVRPVFSLARNVAPPARMHQRQNETRSPSAHTATSTPRSRIQGEQVQRRTSRSLHTEGETACPCALCTCPWADVSSCQPSS